MAKNVTSYKAYRSADSYGSGGPKQKPAKKPNYKSGGMFSTGRAITVAPGTKKNSRVTTPKPSKSAGVNRKTKVTSAMPSKSASMGRKGSTPMRGADAYRNPANKNTNKRIK